MKDLKAFNDRLLKKRDTARISHTGDNAFRLLGRDLGLTEDRILITPRAQIEGEPQVTGGIRLDQLAPMMAKTASVALTGESVTDAAERTTSSFYASAPMAYAKSIARLMARTDLGSIFKRVPEALYYRAYPNEFADLALHVSGFAGQGAHRFFTGTST